MKVAVTGCGWFGLPLAKVLMNKGFEVIGSKRDMAGVESLLAQGIHAVAMDLSDTEKSQSLSALVDVDAMVINIPPGMRRGDNDYLERLSRLKSYLQPERLKKLIFVSTTGVYPNNGVVKEEDAKAYSAVSETLLAAESMFLDAPELLSQGGQACVIRFSGLVGPRRHPGRFLAGKKNISGGQQSVNLVHLDDCIASILTLLNSSQLSRAYSLCTPEHLTKRQFYTMAAIELGLCPPHFDQTSDNDKQVDGNRICDELGFNYQYQTLKALLDAC